MFSESFNENKQLQLICLLIYVLSSMTVYLQQLTQQFILLKVHNRVQNIINFYNNVSPFRHAARIVTITPSLVEKFNDIWIKKEFGYSLLAALMIKSRESFIMTFSTFQPLEYELSDDFKNKTLVFFNSLLK